MVKNYPLRSRCESFSNLQLQSACQERRSITECFAARSRATAFCHSRLQTCKAGAPHQIDQHSRSVNAAPNTVVFGDFLWNQLSVQSSVRFADLIFQKRAVGVSILTFWSTNRTLATVLCTDFPRCRGTTAETETLLRRPQNPHYPEKHRVSRPRVFSPVNSHASQLLHFPATWWWVVDMMMWLTWWCEC